MKAKYKELSDLAFKFQKEGRLEEALDIYNTLININPEDVNILNLLGMLYLEKKEYELAINYLSKAAVLNSTSYVVSNLAKAYYLNKQYLQAIDLYHKALEIEENDRTDMETVFLREMNKLSENDRRLVFELMRRLNEK